MESLQKMRLGSHTKKQRISTYMRVVLCGVVVLTLFWLFGFGRMSCRAELEKWSHAESLVYRLQGENVRLQSQVAELSSSSGEVSQPTSVKETQLQETIAVLREQLAKASSRSPVATVAGGESSNIQKVLLASLQTENKELRRTVEMLQARLGTNTQKLGQPIEALQVAERVGQPVVPVASFPPSPAGNVFTGHPAAGKITIDMLQHMASKGAIAVVVIACKRPQYLRRSLNSFLGIQRDESRFPIIVSQDGFDTQVSKLVTDEFGSRVFHMHHEHDPKASDHARKFGGDGALGYVRIAQHYGFAMRKVFEQFGFQQAIFLEEDMEISPDFYSYFAATLPILQRDPKLFCVSAWNDNGLSSLVQDPRKIYRTDFFPGLGWMLTKSMWDEVSHRWPDAYWDEFMRRPDVRKGRQCLRPEINRSFTFGEEGTSSGQFFRSHLSRIELNREYVAWENLELNAVSSPEAFNNHLEQELRAAIPVSPQTIDQHNNYGETLRIVYDDSMYPQVARKFGLMEDEKEGIRRMSYRGVIPFAWKKNRVYLHTSSFPRL